MQTFFYILLEENAKLQEQQAVIPIERYEKIKEIFHKVLLKAVPLASHSEVFAFARRLVKNLDSIFQFLLYHDVPLDNNASNRAIRNAKVKIKILGFFSSIDGAQ
ncbi:IS66 family transposase [Thorsellia anophelis]|uniref:Transposase IS66 family protein n=1 Tax=Thorsellia anophelis DSM 18579 TaxID=1123402 RepID=A0A1I0FDV3_9GAMM|nr:transposase [Thorsellia anophelis]SET56357.1 Transposase IS66 family protein [Thorsellia anophelis DSM 18579]